MTHAFKPGDRVRIHGVVTRVEQGDAFVMLEGQKTERIPLFDPLCLELITEQPGPTRDVGGKSVDVLAWLEDGRIPAKLSAALRERIDLGRARYGDRLHSFNGRDALRDVRDEVLDGILYASQKLIEVAHTHGAQALMSTASTPATESYDSVYEAWRLLCSAWVALEAVRP